LGATITSPARELRRPLGLGDTIVLSTREVVSEFGFLVVRSGPRGGDIFKLNEPRNVIGRDRDVTVFVDDPHVSGHHASVRCEKVSGTPRGEFVLRDLDSENGTYINGQRAAGETVLKDGDVIEVGQTELVFKRI
jgi:pSer/pThr/pTyr-binding forkhead associated (FHA) protein